MKYTVIRGQDSIILAETRWYEDAKAVLARWHSGYIIANNAIVLSKNMQVGEDNND